MPAPVIRSRLEMQSFESLPGPGAYDQSTKWKGNAISWRPATSIALSDEQPVPSKLDIKHPTGRSATLSFRLKPLTKESYPGPGSYELDGQFSPYKLRTVSPRGTFGSGRQSARDTEKTPGPGAYIGTEVSPRRAAGYSLKGRLAVSVADAPGPGQYDHKDFVGTGLAASFKGSRSAKSHASDTPGPGTYDFHATIGSNA
jgi:hypothetical protein